METAWKTVLWPQFGAAIDMIENAVTACVEHHAAQLNLILRQRTDSSPRWVRRAGTAST